MAGPASGGSLRAFTFLIPVLLLFFAAGFGAHILLSRRRQKRKLRERQAVLGVSLKLSFAEEAKSLKRTEVPHPLARILAVDDEEIVLDAIRKILTGAGYSIDTVESGREALTLVQKNKYDFVFTDLRMPDMEGMELVKAVKFLRPATDVVVITGFASIESAVDTMKSGAMDYLQKPFTDDELIAAVKKFLERRKQEQKN